MIKKGSVLIMLMSLIFAFSSCTKTEEVWMDNPTVFKNVYQTVLKDAWEWNPNNNAYHYLVEMPEITSDVAKKGVIQVSLDLGNNEYRAMPYTLTYEPGVYETLDYEYGLGFVDIFYTQSDLANVGVDKMVFKITVVYNP